MPSKLSDILTGPEKWCQGVLACDAIGNPTRPMSKDACRWCLSGAIWKISIDRDKWEQLAQKLRAACFSLYGTHSYVNWQDKPKRTWDEVKRLIQEAERGDA